MSYWFVNLRELEIVRKEDFFEICIWWYLVSVLEVFLKVRFICWRLSDGDRERMGKVKMGIRLEGINYSLGLMVGVCLWGLGLERV